MYIGHSYIFYFKYLIFFFLFGKLVKRPLYFRIVGWRVMLRMRGGGQVGWHGGDEIQQTLFESSFHGDRHNKINDIKESQPKNIFKKSLK